MRWAIAVAVSSAFGLIPTSAAGPREGDLVDVTAVIPDAVLDMRYATKDNFVGKAVYPTAVCKLHRNVATRLARAAKLLRAQKRRLVLWDCYRPASIQETFWKLVPDERYVANPKKGSRHSRAAAVDVALADADGTLLAMPTAFDDFSEKAHRKKALAGATGREARRLDAAMRKAGFVGMPTEWWHFDAPDAAKYALSDVPL
ncbi:MAG: M15 family metallopeptidase [Kofleriaceae bacterium]